VKRLRALRRARRYDRERGCYVYDISFKTTAPLTERTVEVAEAFGLGVDESREHVLYKDFEVKLAQGDMVYITGDSGSGKSVLLRALRDDLGDEAVSMDMLASSEEGALIDLVGQGFNESLGLLCRVGLNDAFLFLREPRHLSDGQRYRFRLAQLLDRGRTYWLCDEFCSTLDRTTARIVAYNVQKLARRSGATLIVATTHTDLFTDLNPSIHIRKGWGNEILVEYRENKETTQCSVLRDVQVRESSKEEYETLAYLHYRSHRAPVPMAFYAVELGGEVAGVIAYSYPPVAGRGRKQAVGYAPKLDELNRDWALISRVIVHPKYRSIGLGSLLVKDSLPLVGRRHVELVAVMAQYNPFAERAGMKLILRTEPHRKVVEAIEALRSLGFQPSMLGSRGYNQSIIVSVGSQYYRRLSRKHELYVKKADFIEWLGEQDSASMAWTLETLSTLSQSKAYLYWSRDWMEACP